jgi:hypothetical protein
MRRSGTRIHREKKDQFKTMDCRIDPATAHAARPAATTMAKSKNGGAQAPPFLFRHAGSG